MGKLLVVALLALASLGGASGCAPAPAAGPGPAATAVPGPIASNGNPDKLLVVDCLLPGQVRKLGTKLTYLTPRRAVKTSAVECEIRGGEYTAYDRANYETALNVWLPQAEGGDAKAQNYVGEIYERGLGREPDYAVAAQWYRKAAEQGFAPAQLNLGQLYETGRGVPQNGKMAAELYLAASGVQPGTPVTFVAPPPVVAQSTRDPQAEALRSSLTRVEHQLDEARATLAQGSTGSADTTGERARLESQLEDLRAAAKELEQKAGALAGANGGKMGTAAPPSSNGSDADSLAQEIEWLESATEEWRTALERHESERAASIAGPNIQLIDPRLLGRDDPGALPGRGESRIVGRVEAPAGLDKLLVNDREAAPDAKGIFRSVVSVPAAGVEVSIVAIDRQGKRAQRTFELRPDAVADASQKVQRPPDVRFGRYHALLIGNGDYASFPDIATSHADVRALGELLEQRYGFQVTTLLDANRYQILATLDQMRANLTEDDNVLIYFSGRGELQGPTGFWLPSDAKPGQRESWISNQQLTEILEAMNARHVLVVADSCYSGALTRSAAVRLDDDAADGDKLAWQRKVSAQRSRMLLTSGVEQPVAGGGSNSIFASAFIEVLRTNREVLEADRLASELQAIVTYNAETARVALAPDWAAIRYAGHEGGEFFFVPKS